MDNHCGGHYVSVDQAQCSAPPSGNDTGDDFGATLFNTSGYDDDCKYAVRYSASGLCANGDTFFTVTVADAIGGTPVTGAASNGNMVRAEVFLTDTHPANTSKSTSTEISPGVYKIGPIQLDSKGQWTVRFHFFENCTDLPTSPHGHAAFLVDVP
jgi:hypothetical protein